MEPKDMRKIVVDILSAALDVDRDAVTDEAHLKDELGADSLDLAEIVMTIEEKFGVEVSDDDAGKIEQVKDIYIFLEANAS
jgi:acyl carrier protein